MEYDYIILLCADKKDETGNFPDFRNGNYIGGKNRMSAALKYSLEHPEPTFIIAGGFDPRSDHSQKVQDMVDYLRAGNPKIKIIAVPTLPCTRHNFIAIFNKMYSELVGKKIAIFTSHCYIPRTLAIYTKLAQEDYPALPFPNFLCAESILENKETIFGNHKHYLDKIFSETKGLLDIELNQYKDFCLEKEREAFVEIAKSYDYLTTEAEKEIHELLPEKEFAFSEARV